MDVSTRGVVIWLELPPEITELVLSFLSVPELSRTRSVCKHWNQLISGASFHDLCDQNGGSREYMFMWGWVIRKEPMRVVINHIFSDALSFLDIDEQRWYSIPPPRPPGRGHEVESGFKAVNDGIVIELMAEESSAANWFAISISNSFARTWRPLPDPPEVFDDNNCHLILAHLVPTVENAGRSFIVILLDKPTRDTYPPRRPSELYVHEALTNVWRRIPDPPDEIKPVQAIAFQESLFLLDHATNSSCLSLFRYKFQDDTWAEVYRMRFSSSRSISISPALVLSGNRMFLNVWFEGPPGFDQNGSPIDWKSDPDCLEPGAFSEGTHLEMYEILIPDNRRKLVVRLDHAQLERIIGRRLRNYCISSEAREHELKISFALPCVNSDGVCSSVVLGSTGRRLGFVMRRYDLATGSVVLLPPHPSLEFSTQALGDYYTAENMKLSLRNMLARIC